MYCYFRTHFLPYEGQAASTLAAFSEAAAPNFGLGKDLWKEVSYEPGVEERSYGW